jgi:site-specific recombinase XerD
MPRKKTPNAGPLLDDLVTDYLNACEARALSPNTMLIYRETLHQFTAFLADQDQHVRALTRQQHEQFLAHLVEAGMSVSTRITRFRALHSFWQWCLREPDIVELLHASPMANMQEPRADDTLPEVLTDAQILALFKTCGKDFLGVRDEALMRLFLDTGLRLSELQSIHLEQVDLKERIIFVLGKGRKQRFVKFGLKCAASLGRYIRMRSSHPHAADPALWLGRRGAMAVGTIKDLIKSHGNKCGMPWMHAHLLRHTYIDRLKSAGMSDEHIMAMTGHSNLMTLTRYGRKRRSERALDMYDAMSPGDHLDR